MIPLARPYLKGNELSYVRECIETSWISSVGKFVNKFESAFSKFCSSKYGIATCNGTAALHLALKSLRIGKGDEVIMPDLTFIATANAVSYCGAKPVFVDSEALTWNIDPEKIEDKINVRTKAIIVVHLYGHPAQMDMIMKIARKHDLYVIEDCCESHGAFYKKKMVGSIGTLGIFSFYGNKTITTGEGGMIVTNSKSLDSRAKFLRDHAMSKKKFYFHPEIGFNYRMTNLQAAIGLAQFEKADHIIKKRSEISTLYSALLKGLPGIVLPPKERWAKSVCWLYSILVENGKRDKLIQWLKRDGVETRPFFIPMHKMPPYKSGGSFPVSEHLSAAGINLPSFAGIKEKEIRYICGRIRKILVKG